MKRALRLLLNILTLLCLLLFLATLVFWPRSYFRSDWYHYVVVDPRGREWIQYSLNSNKGSLYVSYFNFAFKTDNRFQDYVRLRSAPAGFSYEGYAPRDNHYLTGSVPRRLGFLLESEYNTPDASGSYDFPRAAVPHWFIALITALLPATRLYRALRRRQQNRAGLCRSCGYDLRATPTRCPECGAIPGKSD
jgi:hypothetical protein